jgi:thymidylate kinase
MISGGYRSILGLLRKADVEYIILRYPHIVSRKLLDVDLLCKTQKDYQKSIQTLKQEGFIIIDKEKYRTFLAKKEGNELLLFDIYREVSWLGWVVMHKKALFKRKKNLSNIITVCSDEDELLIYLAQALFKNNNLETYKLEVVTKILSKRLDWNYIMWQVRRFGWEIPLQRIIRKVEKTHTQKLQLSHSFLIRTIIQCTFTRPLRVNIVFRAIRQLFPQRRATTICLLGPDGSGKSTQAKSISKGVRSLFQELEVKTRQEYFGWKPFLPTTKLISKLFAKKDIKIVESMNQGGKSFSLIQEIMLFYYFIEYLAKYVWIIRPQLKKKRVILIDRYFYDMYAHYKYAQRSILFPLLLKLYPRPNYTFVLEVPKVILEKRKDELTEEEMELHVQSYHRLASTLELRRLDTNQPITLTTEEVLETIWRRVARRIA